MSEDAIGRALDLAGMGAAGAIPSVARNALAQMRLPSQAPASAGDLSLTSRNASLYNPPTRSQRPFEADYPRGAHHDEAGRLLADIEGRPLGARYVVGRQVHDGGDVPLDPSRLASIAEGSAGASIEAVAPRALGRDVGRIVKTTDRRSGEAEYNILLARNLPEGQLARVAAHEVGHLIDDIAGTIPTTGLNTELRSLYNTLNNPNRTRDGAEAASWGRPFTPQALGYGGRDVQREMMAEAVRAYMADPNYLKTVAPKTAARIREHVNANPRLREQIQFNMGGSPAAGGGVLARERPETLEGLLDFWSEGGA